MTTKFAPFVVNCSSGKKNVFCEGVLLPAGAESSSVTTVFGPTDAWVNGNPDHPVSWQHPGFVSPPVMDIDYRIRRIACSLSLVEVSGTIEAIKTPCILSPDSHSKPLIADVNLRLRISTLFETAQFQGYLWLKMSRHSAVSSKFLDNGFDRSMVERARSLRPCVGDTFPFLLDLSQCRFGAALLERELDESVFAASLWFPSNNLPVVKGSQLLSKQAFQLNSMIGVFQSLLAEVL